MSQGRAVRQREAVVDSRRERAGQQAEEGAVAGRAPPEHAEQERREERRVHEREHQLQHVHDVVEVRRDVGGRHAEPRCPTTVAARPIQR